MRLLMGIILFALLVFAGMFFILSSGDRTSSQKSDNQNFQEKILWKNDTYKLLFWYPKKYFLEEKNISSNGATPHYAVMLTEDTEENRLMREGKSPGREGSRAITFRFFENPERIPVLTWIENSQESNFHLGEEVSDETKIAGAPAYLYSWSGLYEGQTFAFEHKGVIILASATYLTLNDEIINNFYEILGTIRLL